MSDAAQGKLSPDQPVLFEKQFRFQYEPAQNGYVLLYPEGMIQLQGSAGEIMQRVNGERTVLQIIDDLESKFPGADLRQDVIDFLEAAYVKGWIRQ